MLVILILLLSVPAAVVMEVLLLFLFALLLVVALEMVVVLVNLVDQVVGHLVSLEKGLAGQETHRQRQHHKEILEEIRGRVEMLMEQVEVVEQVLLGLLVVDLVDLVVQEQHHQLVVHP
jgi:hypothetical protein